MPLGSHEIPTHLTVEDRLVFGLTARQALHLMGGCSAAYGAWSQWPAWPLGLRAALAAACLLAAVAFALWRPGGRPLEEWAFAALRYATLPKASVWRTRGPDRATGRRDDAAWAELGRPARLAWAPDEEVLT